MYDEEDIKEKYAELPEDVRAAILSVSVDEIVRGLGTKYKLTIDRIGVLMSETTLVMLGLTHPEDYMNNLKQRLEIPEDLARELVADVNEQIFKPIRESLKRIHNISQEGNVMDDVAQNVYPVTPEDPMPNDATNYKLQATSLTQADEKILAESGIEIQPANNEQFTVNNLQTTEEEGALKRSEVLAGIENPDSIEKTGTGMAAGFTLTKNAPPSANVIISPDQKLTEAVRLPSTESVYEAKTMPKKEDIPAATQPSEAKKIDPYREPI